MILVSYFNDLTEQDETITNCAIFHFESIKLNRFLLWRIPELEFLCNLVGKTLYINFSLSGQVLSSRRWCKRMPKPQHNAPFKHIESNFLDNASPIRSLCNPSVPRSKNEPTTVAKKSPAMMRKSQCLKIGLTQRYELLHNVA